MLRTCDHPGCTTLTLGTLCVGHEAPIADELFPRGRPFALRGVEDARSANGDPDGAPVAAVTAA